jgi:hypothetical protein
MCATKEVIALLLKKEQTKKTDGTIEPGDAQAPAELANRFSETLNVVIPAQAGIHLGVAYKDGPRRTPG